MVTIIDYNDRIYIINLNPLDPDCRIAVSAVYRALGTLNIAIIAPLRHHQPHHHQQRANKKIIKRAGTRDDADCRGGYCSAHAVFKTRGQAASPQLANLAQVLTL